MKKISGVGNDVSRNREKYQVQIHCIIGYKKMTNLVKFGELKMCILISTLLSFLCSPEYNVFELDILNGCWIHHYLNSRFFLMFFETYNFYFYFFKQAGSLELGNTKSPYTSV